MILTVDLTPRMPEVMDQGTRPTCLACAVSDAHQILYAGIDSLSVEALFHGCVERDKTALTRGATLASVTDALGSTGQPEASHWPYLQVQPEDDEWFDPTPSSERFKGTIKRVEPDFERVSQLISLERPVVLVLKVRDSLFVAGSRASLETACGGQVRGLHAVLGVGISQESTWSIRIRNSWGASWGHAGHAQIGRGYFADNIVAAAVVEHGKAAND